MIKNTDMFVSRIPFFFQDCIIDSGINSLIRLNKVLEKPLLVLDALSSLLIFSALIYSLNLFFTSCSMCFVDLLIIEHHVLSRLLQRVRCSKDSSFSLQKRHFVILCELLYLDICLVRC